MMLTSWRGQQFTTPAELVAAVRAGEVRHLLLDEVGCRTPRAASCTPVVRWALAHATDVSARAGLGTGLLLLELHA
ncbi:MAG: hypothetical protein JWO90_1073, partial [Solirubrobacterales bacterium]|nr:hypothetical protein [Solirubrobacterales bacterium]